MFTCWGVVACVAIFVVHLNSKVKAKFPIHKKNILRTGNGILNNSGEILIAILRHTLK